MCCELLNHAAEILASGRHSEAFLESNLDGLVTCRGSIINIHTRHEDRKLSIHLKIKSAAG